MKVVNTAPTSNIRIISWNYSIQDWYFVTATCSSLLCRLLMFTMFFVSYHPNLSALIFLNHGHIICAYICFGTWNYFWICLQCEKRIKIAFKNSFSLLLEYLCSLVVVIQEAIVPIELLQQDFDIFTLTHTKKTWQGRIVSFLCFTSSCAQL